MNYNVRGILLVVFLLFHSLTVATVLMPLAAASIGLSTATIGLLVALPQATGLVVDIPLAGWSDAVGRRMPVIAGCVAGIFAGAIFASSNSFDHLAIAALILGLTMSLSAGPALAFLTEVVAPEAHARIQGYNGAIQGMSALTGAAAVGVLVSTFGPNLSFWFIPVVMGAVVLITSRLHEDKRPAATNPLGVRAISRRYGRVFQLVAKQPAIRMAGTVSTLYQLQMITLGNSFIPIYLVSSRGLTASAVAVLLTVRSLTSVLLSLGFGRIFARQGIVRPIVAGNVLGLAALVLVPLTADPIALIALFACQGAGVAFGPATANLLVTSATTEGERAIGFSANSLIGRIGGLGLPVVLGASAAVGGFGLLFELAAVIGVALIVALWLQGRTIHLQPHPLAPSA